MPGFTHSQYAHPVLFAHYLLSFFEMLERDKKRCQQLIENLNDLIQYAGGEIMFQGTIHVGKEVVCMISKNKVHVTGRYKYPITIYFDDFVELNGIAKLKIPSGIQSGQILRMKGKGFPRIQRSSKGDQLVKIQVETPKKLSSSVKKIMKELSNLDGKVQDEVQKMKF